MIPEPTPRRRPPGPLAPLGAAPLLCLALLGQALAAPVANPQAALERGRIAYEKGSYREVIDTIAPLLYPSIELGSEDAVVEAHRLLALSHLFLNDQAEAEEEVRAIFALRPSYELDPVVDPPTALRFFQGVRQRQDATLRELREREVEERRRREAEEAARRRERAVVIERAYRHNSRLVATLPFGIGQFQNGHRKMGILFAVTQAATAALSLGCWIAVESKWSNRPVRRDEADQANAVQNTQIVAGATFWGLVLWGIIDAQVRFVPRLDVSERERPPAPSAPAPVSPQPASPSPGAVRGSLFRWSPSVLVQTDLLGLGAQGVF